MSTVDVSPLKADVDQVIAGRERIRLDRWQCAITAQGKEVQVLKVVNVDIQEYYENHYFAIRTIDVMMGMGQYATILYPGRKEIEVNLVRQDSQRAGINMQGEYEGVLEDEHYIGILVNQRNPMLEDAKIAYADTFSLDISSIEIVRLQLISKVEEQVRLVQVGGVYRQTTIDRVLAACMTDAIKSIETDQKFLPRGIDVAPVDNEQVYEQIIIPHGLKLVDLPGYLQRQYGVYNTGLAHFIRAGVWYIFPTYNTERLKNAQYAIQISVVSPKHYPMLGQTYRRWGRQVSIIANGERMIEDLSEGMLGNDGNGALFMDANAIAGNPVNTQEPNRAVLDMSNYVSDYVAYPNSDGINNVPVYRGGITSNAMNAMSEITLRAGCYLTIAWNFSDPDLLVPGALARIKFCEGSTIREVDGVLVGAIHAGKLYGEGFTVVDFWNQSALRFFVRRDLGLIDATQTQN